MYGWAGQRLKVYLTEGKIVKEPLPEDFRLEYLGCRGFNSKTLFDEVRAGIDPLGPDNVFIVGVGTLAGTLAPGNGRWKVTAKGPLTGTFADGSGGGDFGAELKFAGYDQIIIYGRSPKPVYLWINDDHVELRDASHLWSKTTWDTHKLLVKELGDREIRELSIGPAGENLGRTSKLICNTTRAGGKGGIGAVAGSKNLKAVVVRGTGSVKIANPAEFYKAVKHCLEKLDNSAFHKKFKVGGTFNYFDHQDVSRSKAVRNAQEGYMDGWENYAAPAYVSQYKVKNTGCFACPISCTAHYQVKEGPYATHGAAAEYGTTYPYAQVIGSTNLAAALKMATLSDQLGLDAQTTGMTISFAMECWQRGLLTVEDTGGLDLSWGNVDAVIQLLPKIAYREGFLGNLLAEGSQRASRQIGGSEVCLNTVKGMEMSGYFPGEGSAYIGHLGWATAPVGGTLHRGTSWTSSLKDHSRVKAAMGEEVFQQRLDKRSYLGQGAGLSMTQDLFAVVDSLGTCMFLSQFGGDILSHNDLAWLFSTATGVKMDGDDLLKAGERIFTMEKAFNVREGFKRKDDTLPEKFFVEKETPHGIIGVNKAKFEIMLDEYYQFRGWDKEGIPTKQKLEELNLSYIAEQTGAR
ncbi:MAG: aldehyde ferredoxin oxidoreductase family protein [Chloroflexi bacterium]|nr:aldehyde ferredoxin oxidoreductase family protein [Chloroflexota bacterium]